MVKVIHSLSTELGNPPGSYRKAGWEAFKNGEPVS